MNHYIVPPLNCFFLLSVILWVTSCGGKSEESPSAILDKDAVAVAETSRQNKTERNQVLVSQPEQERKLIRNGTMDMKVDNVSETKAEIIKICRELNAYLSNESETNYGDRLLFQHTIRVPAAKFDDLLARLEGLADKVENKNIITEDVTEQFIDTEARLKTKKELEARYLEILKQARSVEDILSVESQLNHVRSEIESMEGRLKYLRNQVAFSTLNLSYYQMIGTDFGFFSKFGSSLVKGWQNLLSLIIFLFTLWPFAVAIIAAGLWWKKRKKANQTQV
jgi:hypothetical protein